MIVYIVYVISLDIWYIYILLMYYVAMRTYTFLYVPTSVYVCTYTQDYICKIATYTYTGFTTYVLLLHRYSFCDYI